MSHSPRLLLTVSVQDAVAAVILKGAHCWVEPHETAFYRPVEYHSVSDDSPRYYTMVARSMVASREGFSTHFAEGETEAQREGMTHPSPRPGQKAGTGIHLPASPFLACPPLLFPARGSWSLVQGDCLWRWLDSLWTEQTQD